MLGIAIKHKKWVQLTQDKRGKDSGNQKMNMKMHPKAKVFVPFTEAISTQLLDALGLSSTDLVPFQLDYQCVQIDLIDDETSPAAASEVDA